MSDQRRMVLSETPRCLAASEVERPRRRPGPSEPWRVRGVIGPLTAVWSGFDRLDTALQRFGTENHPAPRGEAQRQWHQAGEHERVQTPPDARDPPVEVQ